MTQVLRETHIVERGNRNYDGVRMKGSAATVIARVVYFVAGIVTGLLALRFILALLGANPSNPFADFIYTASHPFVAPFFGLFNYRSVYGVSRFELNTLIAIVVYTLAAWLIVKLVAIITNTDEDEIDA